MPIFKEARWRLLALVLVALTPPIARADWEAVGNRGFSMKVVLSPALALSSGGMPYVAYQQEKSAGGKVTVMRFNGTTWETVGNPEFSAGGVESLSLALTSRDVPYVAYRDLRIGGGGKATVMRLNGATWETVGSQGFSGGGVTHPSLAMSSGDVPYVAYRDVANSNKATVMRFVNNAWEPVGTPGFSQGMATYLSLALSSRDEPYVAYQADTASPSTGSGAVMRFVNGDWEAVGNLRLLAGKANNFSLVLSSNDVPYVAYEDWEGIPDTALTYNGATTVTRFVNGDWELVGDRGFSKGNATDPSLALSSKNELYVANRDGAEGFVNRATVMRFALPPEPEPPALKGGVTAVPAFPPLVLLALALGLGAVMRTGLRRRGG